MSSSSWSEVITRRKRIWSGKQTFLRRGLDGIIIIAASLFNFLVRGIGRDAIIEPLVKERKRTWRGGFIDPVEADRSALPEKNTDQSRQQIGIGSSKWFVPLQQCPWNRILNYRSWTRTISGEHCSNNCSIFFFSLIFNLENWRLCERDGCGDPFFTVF